MSKDILDLVGSMDPPAGRLTGLSALQTILGRDRFSEAVREGGYRMCAPVLEVAAEELPRKFLRSLGLRRGDIVSTVIDDIDLPAENQVLVKLMNISHRSRYYLSRPELMLRPNWKELLDSSSERAYTDPGLRGKRAMLRLALRLYRSSMLGPARRRLATCAIFCVVKKIKVDPLTGKTRVLQRMILDLRRNNVAFADPPWMSLGGVGAFCYLDGSAALRDGAEFGFAGGDLPDYYYTLEIPGWLTEFFIIDVTVRDLRRAVLAMGWDWDWPEWGEFVGLKVLGMGYSWACWFAQVGLEDVTSSPAAGLDSSRSLIHGVMVPPLGIDLSQCAVIWRYIDDYGLAVIEIPSDTGKGVLDEHLLKIAEECPEAWDPVEVMRRPRLKTLALAVRKAIISSGFRVHKEEFGSTIQSLGMLLNSSPPSIRPMQERLWLLYEASLYLATLDVAPAMWVETLIGMWSWFCVLRRPLFSIIDKCYVFIRLHRGDPPVRLWPAVRDELGALAGVAFFLQVDLASTWYPFAYMCDASPTGYAVIRAPAGEEELRAEAGLGVYGGWSVSLDRAIDEACGVVIDALPEELPELWVDGRSLFYRLAYFLGGVRAEGDLEDVLTELAAQDGSCVGVEYLDPRVDPVTCDFLQRLNCDRELEKFRAGWYQMMVGWVPRATWAPSFGAVGPWRDLRRQEAWTHSSAPPRFQEKLERGNLLAAFLLSAALEAFKRGGVYCLMLRASRRESALFAAVPELVELLGLSRGSAQEVHLLGRASLMVFHNLGQLVVEGRPETGEAFIRESLCPRLVRWIREESGSSGNLVPRFEMQNMAGCALTDLAEAKVESLGVGARLRQRAPPVGTSWDSLTRWKVVVKGLWKSLHEGKTIEHNNLSEARGILGCLRHAGRSRDSRGKRMLVMTDSLVCLGLFAKGRTSSRGLLRLARIGAGYQLGLRITLYLRFVPTDRNWADGPSRQSRLGVLKTPVQVKRRAPGWQKNRLVGLARERASSS